jgi:alkyl sulfatase BDS1-like metallo-beta-lactamase superfamily hydrolase
MGGADAVVEKARASFAAGDYRWAAEVLNHVVFAQQDHQAARDLLADTYEQLGYGSENGTWRNFYLGGAAELRDGPFGTPTETAAHDVIGQLTPATLFDAIAIQVNGPAAWDENLSIDIVLTDTDERYRLRLANGVLVYSNRPQKGLADATLTTTKSALPAIALGGVSADGLSRSGLELTGDASVLDRLAAGTRLRPQGLRDRDALTAHSDSCSVVAASWSPA